MRKFRCQACLRTHHNLFINGLNCIVLLIKLVFVMSYKQQVKFYIIIFCRNELFSNKLGIFILSFKMTWLCFHIDFYYVTNFQFCNFFKYFIYFNFTSSGKAFRLVNSFHLYYMVTAESTASNLSEKIKKVTV